MEKKKILIIDDEEAITAVFKILIEKTGKYEAMTETSGSQAFAAAKRFRPDLVLLDIMMPGIDGGEVARKMKADEETRDIPIVFVTAAVTKEEAKKQGTIQGGYPILAKPVHEEELIDTIEKYAPEKTMSGKVMGAPSLKGGKDAQFADRRKNKRIEAGSLLSYVCMNENDTQLGEGIGDALNISQGGLLLVTSLPIESEYIQLASSSTNDKLIEIEGKVIYTHMPEPDVFHAGINFLGSNEKIREFVVELIKVVSLKKNGKII